MVVYKKTHKGMNELLARPPGIDPRLVDVLVLVDGTRDSTEIARLAREGNLPADGLDILMHGGYLEQKFKGSLAAGRAASAPAVQARPVAQTPIPPAPTPKPAPAPAPAARSNQNAASTAVRPTAKRETAPVSEQTSASLKFKEFHALYTYLVGQTKGLLGLRGFGFQLRIERATTLNELQTLIRPLSGAIEKKHGLETAENFKREGELLIGLARAEQYAFERQSTSGL